MFINPQWPAPEQVKACTSTRVGGVSTPPHDSFNLGFYFGDQPEQVFKNREILRQTLNLPTEPSWVKQVHGSTVVAAESANPLMEADGVFTQQPGKVCVVLTADCLPILFCNKQGSKVAAVHAGWRGLAKGIIKSALTALDEPAENLLVWLGPAIGPEKFEIGEDVYTAFVANKPENAPGFKAISATKWLANLYELARIQLRAQGINAIYGGDFCTVSQPEQFYSYRRDQKQTGSMASLIWIDPLPLP